MPIQYQQESPACGVAEEKHLAQCRQINRNTAWQWNNSIVLPLNETAPETEEDLRQGGPGSEAALSQCFTSSWENAVFSRK